MAPPPIPPDAIQNKDHGRSPSETVPPLLSSFLPPRCSPVHLLTIPFSSLISLLSLSLSQSSSPSQLTTRLITHTRHLTSLASQSLGSAIHIPRRTPQLNKSPCAAPPRPKEGTNKLFSRLLCSRAFDLDSSNVATQSFSPQAHHTVALVLLGSCPESSFSRYNGSH